MNNGYGHTPSPAGGNSPAANGGNGSTQNAAKKALGILLPALGLAACLPLAWLACGALQGAALAQAGDVGTVPPWAAGDTQRQAFRQILCIFGVWAAGWLLLWALRGGLGEALRALLALPCGVALVFAAGLCLLSLGVPYTAWTLVAAVAVLLAAALLVGLKRPGGKKPAPGSRGRTEGAARLLQVALCAFIATAVCVAGFSCKHYYFDSVYYYQMNGKLMAAAGRLIPEVDPLVLSIGMLLPVVCTLPELFAFGAPMGFNYAMALCAAGVFVCILWQRLPARWRLPAKAAAALATALLCWTRYPVVYLVVMLLSNLYAMVYLFLAAVLVWLLAGQGPGAQGAGHNPSASGGPPHAAAHSAPPSQNPGTRLGWDSLAALGLLGLGLCFSRVEGMFFLLILIVAAVPLGFTKGQLAGSLVLPGLGLMALYYGSLFLVHGAAGDEIFLSAGRVAAILGIYAAVLLYVLFVRDKNPWGHKKHVGLFMIAGLGLLCVAAFALWPQRVAGNLFATAIHIFSYNRNEIVIALGILFLAVLCWQRLRPDYLDTCLISYFLFYILIFAIRPVTQHTGITDSGGRILMQAYPLLLAALLAKLPAGGPAPTLHRR